MDLLGTNSTQPDPSVTSPLKTTMVQAVKLLKEGQAAKALAAFQLAVGMARQARDLQMEARALVSIGGCQILLFQYRAAVFSLTEARKTAFAIKDQTRAGAASVNLAVLYSQLGDFSLADKEAKESIRLLANSTDRSALCKALLNAGEIESQQGHLELALNHDRQAISISQDAGLTTEEAIGYDHRGVLQLEAGHLSEAEADLLEAYRLRVLQRDENRLAISRANLARLKYEQKQYAAGLTMLDAALTSKSLSFRTVAPYIPVHLRGQILVALGRSSDALREFKKAVDLAGIWRAGALPGDTTSTDTIARLNVVYQDYADLAAHIALEKQDRALAGQALAALAENRASSLREQRALTLERENRLPLHYFELLSQLQSAQSRAVWSKTPGDEAKAAAIRLELSDLENKIGLASQDIPSATERISPKKTLGDIQSRIGKNEALLSFFLGKQRSYLWTVTKRQVNLYQLPMDSEISQQASTFSSAVKTNRDIHLAGRGLSHDLLSQIDEEVWKKPEWLVVADGHLLDGIPWAALPEKDLRSQRLLSTEHSIRLLPSELLLLARKGAEPHPLFLGVGDPIYNLADPRHRLSQNTPKTGPLVGLGRLAGSQKEIRTSAQMSGFSQTKLLTGREASLFFLRGALQEKPAILHFAVHVVSPSGHMEQAALALSLTEDNMPELLTPEAIASLHLANSLVVLSGCFSEQGRVLPGAGLIGLSRAWLVAGASAVIVSAWSTPDNSGDFFSSFYRYFHQGNLSQIPSTKQAAAALQQAQIEMQHKSDYRSLPSFWAAYSIIAKE